MRDHESRYGTLRVGWNSPPNYVTYARIVLAVIFIGFALAAGPWGQDNHAFRWIAAALFALAAASDKLDGWMARTYGNVTVLGTLLDPIADKLLICSALVIASVFGELNWIVTALFLIREIGITVMRMFVIDDSGKVIAASRAGKYKTFTQCVGLGLLLAPVWLLNTASATPMWLTMYYTLTYAFIYIALILCLYSGLAYVLDVREATKP